MPPPTTTTTTTLPLVPSIALSLCPLSPEPSPIVHRWLPRVAQPYEAALLCWYQASNPSIAPGRLPILALFAAAPLAHRRARRPGCSHHRASGSGPGLAALPAFLRCDRFSSTAGGWHRRLKTHVVAAYATCAPRMIGTLTIYGSLIATNNSLTHHSPADRAMRQRAAVCIFSASDPIRSHHIASDMSAPYLIISDAILSHISSSGLSVPYPTISDQIRSDPTLSHYICSECVRHSGRILSDLMVSDRIAGPDEAIFTAALFLVHQCTVAVKYASPSYDPVMFVPCLYHGFHVNIMFHIKSISCSYIIIT